MIIDRTNEKIEAGSLGLTVRVQPFQVSTKGFQGPPNIEDSEFSSKSGSEHQKRATSGD